MWVYEQATGHLFELDPALNQSGVVVGTGYSGSGVYKNRPDAQSLKDLGPIPCGIYTIGKPFDSSEHGPYCLPLLPHIGNEMFDRDNFLMHGDSKHAPGTASHGCVIMSRAIRELVGESEDDLLSVVRGDTAGDTTQGGIAT